MIEQEYLTVTNLAQIRMIAAAMEDIMDGDEYGVDKEIYKRAYLDILYMQHKLLNAIKIEDE